MTHATLSAGQSGVEYKRARDVAAPAHLRALKAAKPRIQAMIQDGVKADLLPKQPLEARLAAVIETTSPPTLTLLMMRTKPRQSCTFRRRPRQQKRHGSKQLEYCRAERHKPDSISVRSESAPEEPTQCAAAPSAASTAN